MKNSSEKGSVAIEALKKTGICAISLLLALTLCLTGCSGSSKSSSRSSKSTTNSQSQSNKEITTPEVTVPQSSIPAGAINWQDAGSYMGQNVTIYGPVKKASYKSSVNGKPTYIDIGVAYPDTSGVSAIVWGEDRSNFSSKPESAYNDKNICVTGLLYEYKGSKYIKVTSPDQIQVVD